MEVKDLCIYISNIYINANINCEIKLETILLNNNIEKNIIIIKPSVEVESLKEQIEELVKDVNNCEVRYISITDFSKKEIIQVQNHETNHEINHETSHEININEHMDLTIKLPKSKEEYDERFPKNIEIEPAPLQPIDNKMQKSNINININDKVNNMINIIEEYENKLQGLTLQQSNIGIGVKELEDTLISFKDIEKHFKSRINSIFEESESNLTETLSLKLEGKIDSKISGKINEAEKIISLFSKIEEIKKNLQDVKTLHENLNIKNIETSLKQVNENIDKAKQGSKNIVKNTVTISIIACMLVTGVFGFFVKTFYDMKLAEFQEKTNPKGK